MYDAGLSKYSIALYDVAKESDDFMLDKLEEVRGAYKDPELLLARSHPKLRPEARRAVIKGVFGDDLPEPLLNLLLIVADNGRSYAIDRIIQSYEELCFEDQRIERIRIVTPMPISEEKVEAIRAAYAKNRSGDVKAEAEVDPSLIGGVKIVTDEGVIDYSLSRQLADLEHSLR